MADPSQEKDARRFAVGLGAFYAALFFGFGLYQPFFPVWLQSRGLDEAMIGIALAAASSVRLVATPLITWLADRGGSLSAAIVVCSIAAAASYAGLTQTYGFWPIVVVIMIGGVFWSPVLPLVDAYGLAGVARRGLDYGRIRVWGSISFMAANIAGGLFLAVASPSSLIYFLAASLAVMIVAALTLERDKRQGEAQSAGTFGFIDKRFALVALASALLQASHALYYGFAAIQWKAAGYSGAAVGALWALSVLAEIALFWIGGRLTVGWRPTTFLLIGGAACLIRWGAMALDPGTIALIPLQLLHAASFGLVHLGTMAYLADRLRPHERASGQGLVSVLMGVGMASVTVVAGYLVAEAGARAYLVMALVALAGVLLAAYARSLPRLQPQREEAGG